MQTQVPRIYLLLFYCNIDVTHNNIIKKLNINNNGMVLVTIIMVKLKLQSV